MRTYFPRRRSRQIFPDDDSKIDRSREGRADVFRVSGQLRVCAARSMRFVLLRRSSAITSRSDESFARRLVVEIERLSMMIVQRQSRKARCYLVRTIDNFTAAIVADVGQVFDFSTFFAFLVYLLR